MKRREEVVTSTEDRQEIAQKFNVPKYVISRATHFCVNSLEARKIRCYAVNTLGCKVYIHSSRVL